MRRASQVIAFVSSLMQPCEDALPSAPGKPVGAVQGDLAGAAVELLQDGRARAGRERERTAVLAG